MNTLLEKVKVASDMKEKVWRLIVEIQVIITGTEEFGERLANLDSLNGTIAMW